MRKVSVTANTTRCLAALLFAVAARPLTGQYVRSQSSTIEATRKASAADTVGWRAIVQSKAAVQYDDNVFLLSPTQRGTLSAPSAASVTSGRYTGMESANDMLGVGSIGVELSGPGVAGRTLEITPEISYEFASRNQLRREGVGTLSIAQSLGKGRRVRVNVASTPSHFARNYLSDAVDADANGSISAAERIYKRGQYGEYSLGGDFRVPLGSKSKKRVGAVLTAGAGYYARSYDAPFAVRDLKGPTGTLGLAFGQNAPVGLDLTYDIAALSAAQGKQVDLLDEPTHNVDFNGNGTTTDLNARALVDIDRSRLEHQFGVGLTFDAGRRATASLGYDYRLRSFRSKLPYDESDAGRSDARSGIRGSVRTRLAHGVFMSSGVKFLTQSTNRPLGSVVGDEADYRNLVASLSLRAAF